MTDVPHFQLWLENERVVERIAVDMNHWTAYVLYSDACIEARPLYKVDEVATCLTEVHSLALFPPGLVPLCVTYLVLDTSRMLTRVTSGREAIRELFCCTEGNTSTLMAFTQILDRNEYISPSMLIIEPTGTVRSRIRIYEPTFPSCSSMWMHAPGGEWWAVSESFAFNDIVSRFTPGALFQYTETEGRFCPPLRHLSAVGRRIRCSEAATVDKDLHLYIASISVERKLEYLHLTEYDPFSRNRKAKGKAVIPPLDMKVFVPQNTSIVGLWKSSRGAFVVFLDNGSILVIADQHPATCISWVPFPIDKVLWSDHTQLFIVSQHQVYRTTFLHLELLII